MHKKNVNKYKKVYITTQICNLIINPSFQGKIRKMMTAFDVENTHCHKGR